VSAADRVIAALPRDASGVILESPGAVSWFLDGAAVSVPLGGTSVVAVLVTRNRVEVRCQVMELERLSAEHGIEGAIPVEWDKPLVPAEWLDEPGVRSEGELQVELRAARAALTDAEADRYRTLGSEVAAAVTTVAAATRADMSEQSVAGDLADCLYSIGTEPVVLLVAGASRIAYRHPLPTAGLLGDRAMLVVGARRHGLIVNLTRWVRFSGSDMNAEAGIRAVEADLLDATVPGTTFAALFARVQAAYPAHGFDPHEWRNHHQGGPTGYVGRDPKIGPDTPGVVAQQQAFAWNPSAPGVKAEDTVLATTAGIELLTHDPAWPTELVASRPRPLTMLR